MSPSEQREDVLLAFSTEPRQDRDTLERYIRQYPDFAEDLVDLSYELRLVRECGTSDVTDDQHAADAAFEQLLNAGAKAASRTVDLFEDRKGPAFAALARSLNVPKSILAALRDRLVVPITIPMPFLRRLAGAMGRELSEVLTYIQQAPRTGALSHKADGKPVAVEQVTFDELVRTTTLTEEQSASLLADTRSDGRD